MQASALAMRASATSNHRKWAAYAQPIDYRRSARSADAVSEVVHLKDVLGGMRRLDSLLEPLSPPWRR